MNIYLFLKSKILTFLIPKNAYGSFSFDEFEDEQSKLINIEAIDDEWNIYSTSNVKIIENKTPVERLKIVPGRHYILRRNNINYLIYISDINNNISKLYNFDSNFDLTIGKKQDSSIIINNNLVGDVCAKIKYENGKIVFEKSDYFCYLDGKIISSQKQEVRFGQQINIYHLKIVILPNIILIIGDNNILLNNILKFNLKNLAFQIDDIEDISIDDQQLYNKSDYYFKTPRLRRFIKTKDIKFSKPPVSNNSDEMPAILTLGPMFTMAIVSGVTVSNSIMNLNSPGGDISRELPQLITAGSMLVSAIVWPVITRWYTKRLKKRKQKKLEKRYSEYLEERKVELDAEAKYQSDVLKENLLSTRECLDVLIKHGYNFWDRRSDQDDFLQVRLGIGSEKLDVDIDYSEDDFTIEEDALKKQADSFVKNYERIYDVPVKYSFFDNKITAIIGNYDKSHAFINNLLLQLLTFYTYEDLKIVVFTNNENKDNWDYLKYVPHNFSNEKDIRFFSSNIDNAKVVSEYLSYFANQRNEQKDMSKPWIPYFIVLIDDYNMVKSFDFMKTITEAEKDLGFSIVLIQERLNELPSKCDNFISIGQTKKCEIIRNTKEEQEHLEFEEEILYDIDMMRIARNIANIPIEFESGETAMPDSLSFLEMEKVGKVEQLNILNRWNTNDSTISLRSEVGVDTQGNLIYLDLHEKEHGPHGLVAGTTGSGKSEFIITYVLSLCVNFSPDIVSFVLIDYKGGGLALAFENRTTGVVLPHLAGTITNLDKGEMDRTLVSIDSEVKRRQKIFNKAREALGESTIDIYKYQRYYKEGKLEEPVTHLFIICDEFAELKSQQPEFMDNLISIARIGRSLGVHLILATQKPSGVVNEQIWSNSKFKVCLKVQDEGDSKEMLKKPDAAYIKQAGRFYLQVGYDEYYVLGQSGWCGAKYFPSDKIVKEEDKSVNFINDAGLFIKSISGNDKAKVEAEGDQFSSIMSSIIDVAKKVNKQAKRLWLDNINPLILVDDVINKYNLEVSQYNVNAILGEYDAPEKQYQDIVKYNYLDDGNTLIYGNDGSENEMLLDAMIYSTCKRHTADEVNFYIIDYGSESMRKYEKLPQIGGIVYASDEEKYNNLIKLIKEEITSRKRLFANYGGEYKNYIKISKLPIIVVMLNNFDAIIESNESLYDTISDLVRDSERYGVVFILTCSTINSVRSKVASNFPNVYAFKLKDKSDYSSIFGIRSDSMPRDIFGRGFVRHDKLHEFQTASLIENSDQLYDFIDIFIKEQETISKSRAKKIPMLPSSVKFDDVKDKFSSINKIPVGISANDLEVIQMDFFEDLGTMITANRLPNTQMFVKSLISMFKAVNGLELFVLDPLKTLNYDKNYIKNYFNDNFEEIIKQITEYVDKLKNEKSNVYGIVLIYGLDKFISKIETKSVIDDFSNVIKAYEKIGVIVVDDALKLKNYIFEQWFKVLFNMNNGVWIGKGIYDQSLLHLSSVTKSMNKDIPNNMGYIIKDSSSNLCKVLDFFSKKEED